jgi:hypothetical protein
VLRQHYGGYELPGCWARHIHAVRELSTLVAEWHRTYGGTRPDLARALEFYDRWLPGTMRRIIGITRQCIPQCVTLRGPGDRAGLGCGSGGQLREVCGGPSVDLWDRVGVVPQRCRAAAAVAEAGGGVPQVKAPARSWLAV